jgi:hypothetical protein
MQFATTRAVASATCDVMEAAEQAGRWQNLARRTGTSSSRSTSEGLSETDEKVRKIYEAINEQLAYLHDTRSVRLDEALEAMACRRLSMWRVAITERILADQVDARRWYS